VWTAL